jgi:chromosomal replication initiator protein
MAPADPNLWQRALEDVRGEFPGGPIPPWLAQAELDRLDASRLAVTLPHAAGEEALGAALRSALHQAIERAVGRQLDVEFRCGGDAGAALAAVRQRRDHPPLNPLYVFDNFVTGPCNRMAHASALAVSDLPGRAYNPLFIHASVGLGKSHLMQAICHQLARTRPDVAMMYLSCEEFVNQFIAAIERGQIEQFRYKFRYLDVLVIDDVHFLAAKDRTQEEFFHTFNALYQAQKQVVLSSDSPPHEIPQVEERLVSRFKWGLVVRIDRPSYETRVAIIRKKAHLRGEVLPKDVVKYLATVVDTNNRELEGAVVRVLGHAALCDRAIDIDLAKEALRDLVGSPSRTITIQDITDAVLQRFNVRLSDLQSRRRTQAVTLPRQVCMYLARRLTNRSLQEIGAFFGGRDHTTVLHAERKIHGIVTRDPAFRGLLEAIETQVLKP